MTKATPPRRLAWLLLAAAIAAIGIVLRGWQLKRQLLLDDEWHALHKLAGAGYADIASHFGLADYCIPLTLYFRALLDLGWLTEWSMHLPPLLAGIALMAVGFQGFRDVADNATRTLWLGLVALSPVLVYLSRTARPYTLAALAVLIAVLAITRYWRDGGHRNAIVYMIATAAAAWLHVMTLAFTLSPLLLFGAIGIHRLLTGNDRSRAGGSFGRLLAVAFATFALVLALLLPALLNDWVALSQKAGGGAVTLESAWRTWLMLAGSGYPAVGIVVAILAALGVRPLWRRDREFTACVLFLMVLGSAAIIASRPAWIQHPGVLARYLEPALALLLLFVAQGMTSLFARLRSASVQMAMIALALTAAFVAGPIPETLYFPNQFFGHPRFQFDYDATRNPYRDPTKVALGEPISPFYQSLADLPAGSVRLIEAPWPVESNYNPHDRLQRVHRQFIKAGMVSGVCGSSSWGDLSALADTVHFREYVPVSTLLQGATWGADYLVIRPQAPIGTAADAPAWPDMQACLPRLQQAFGEPIYRDDEITVFGLKRRP